LGFDRAELAPDDKGISFQLARALFASGQRAAAVETLERVVQRDPNDVQVLIQLGRMYEEYRRILDLGLVPPLDVDLPFALGRSLEAELFVQDYLARGGDPRKPPPSGSPARTSRAVRHCF
jgi:hypothetical protein